jgi:predicted helicase
MMADKAKMLAYVIKNALESDEESKANSTLCDQMNAFRSILIHDIDAKAFADIYAQTIAYGMFAARLHDPTLDSFSRQEAAELVPKTNPFLRKLFQYIAGYDLDERIEWIVDALADIFRAADVSAILKNFGKSTQTHDPIMHFYETFLAEYDPKLRKSRGVYYTPEPVVDFIVRAVDDILKTEFNLPQGLADTSKVKMKEKTPVVKKGQGTVYEQIDKEYHKVQILDPATGTGTFLAQVIKQIYKNFENQQGVWPQYVEEHLIPRLNGFELLMASYAMAHLKLDLLLTELSAGNEQRSMGDERLRRFQIYLTSALEEYHPDTGTLWASWLSAEANEANHIKRDTPVMVVIGNPPYSGESANKGDWIMSLMEDYKKEPGGKIKLKERNPKWINADEIKFLRLGQYYVEKNGDGILAFITAHGFLDHPTLRGMRWQMLRVFDKILVLDLHGNSIKKETSPDGSVDKNVFDIKQGVSINLFIKSGNKPNGELGKLFHADVFGSRDVKYHYLISNDIASTSFQPVDSTAPMFFFVPKDFTVESGFNSGFSVRELFEVNNVGVVTSRDEIVFDENRTMLTERMRALFTMDRTRIQQTYNLKEKQVEKLVALLSQAQTFDSNCIRSANYRPFDNRFLYYEKNLIERNRFDVMRNFLHEDNVGLVIGRQGQVVGSMPWNLAFMSKGIVDFNVFYRGGGYIFPLYRHDRSSQQTLGAEPEMHPNLNVGIIRRIASGLGLQFVPEKVILPETGSVNQGYSNDGTGKPQTFDAVDLLDYIYAVLHSPSYREKYKEFLKIDFPRVPYPKNAEEFWQLAALGSELRQIHLLESPKVNKFITGYPVSGDNLVEKLAYKNGNVYINANQYFAGVPETAWNFYIGGYQPAQKWLKDRKGRTLSFDDIQHYQKIIVALTETARIMKEIDQIPFLESHR